MATMKVLIYSHDWAPVIGGVQTITMSLAQGLAEERSGRGSGAFEVTLVTPTPADGMNDARLPFRVVRRPSLTKLLGLLREADVVHLAGPALAPLLGGWLLGKPVVVQHHGYQAACPDGLLVYVPEGTVCPNHFLGRRYQKCLRCHGANVGRWKSLLHVLLAFPRRWLCQRVQANVTVSNHVSERLGLPRSRTIYNGIGEVPAAPAPGPTPASSLCLAYVGRLVPEKGVDVFLRAAALLQGRDCEFRLKIIGDGPDRARLEKMTDELGLRRRATFAGYLQGEALEGALREVAATVMPSVCEEAAPMAAIEQMMCGRLLIASRIGALGELVGETGLLFPARDPNALAECMKRVLDDPEIASCLGAAARKRALALYCRERMVNDHLHLYREILASRCAEEKVPSTQ